MTTNQDLFWEPEYHVTPDGEAFRIHNNGNITKLTLNHDLKGYTRFGINIKQKGIKKNMLMHRAVAIKYIPNEDCLPQVHHIDSDPTNNCVDNLMWVSQLQNILAKPCLSKNGNKNLHQYQDSGRYMIEFWRNNLRYRSQLFPIETHISEIIQKRDLMLSMFDLQLT